MLPDKVTHTLVLDDNGQTVSGTLTPTGKNAIPLQDVQMCGKALTFRVKLGHLESWSEARRQNAVLYDELLAGSASTHRVGIGKQA
jgi:hypothetical protein